jgi:dihydropteroate synthase
MTKLMGIVNTTPDSFYANSRCVTEQSAIQRGIEMYEQGADILDIGGESSRPKAAVVTEEEELERVLPVIKALSQSVPIPLSIDTVKVKVAEEALKAGASFINDITGFQNPDMCRLAAESGVQICVMHMQGNPATMQQNPNYPQGITSFLKQWFQTKIESLLSLGVQEKQIILDPGIGFGKTVADNLEIIDNLSLFKAIGLPLLLGISRKSFMGKILNKPAAELLPGTIAINAVAIMRKVDIIRVHDVNEHRAIINLLDSLTKKNV